MEVESFKFKEAITTGLSENGNQLYYGRLVLNVQSPKSISPLRERVLGSLTLGIDSGNVVKECVITSGANLEVDYAKCVQAKRFKKSKHAKDFHPWPDTLSHMNLVCPKNYFLVAMDDDNIDGAVCCPVR